MGTRWSSRGRRKERKKLIQRMKYMLGGHPDASRFDFEAFVDGWLTTPNPRLRNLPPATLLRRRGGYRRCRALLEMNWSGAYT